MKIYGKKTVWDAAEERLDYLFAEFDEVIVNFSGGKDSTVTLNLALRAATRAGRLPLKVMFTDQEAEWQSTIDYVRLIMARPDVEPIWLQVPFRLFNAASQSEEWLTCWDPEKEEDWIRPKEPTSVKENVYGVDRFAKLFEAYNRHHFPDRTVARLSGVRCEESPARQMGLTTYPCYKHITWGSKEDVKRGHYTFCPLYDWSYTDVWKAIHDNGWQYCSLYDAQYQYGVAVANMRVSSVTHETALRSLFYLQEVEAETWNRITARLTGINSVAQMREDFTMPQKLPHMFGTWKEYRDYLLEHLILDEGHRTRMAGQFASDEANFDPVIHDKVFKMHIKCILTNDYHTTRIRTFCAAHGRYLVNGRFGNGSRSKTATSAKA